MSCLCGCKHSKTTAKSHLRQKQELTSDTKMFWKLARCSWMAENTSLRLLEVAHSQATIGSVSVGYDKCMQEYLDR